MIRRNRGSRRRGIALLVVFVMVMLITLAAYRFSFVMQSEYRLAKLYEEQVDARQSAWSGIEHASLWLDKPLSNRPNLSVPQGEPSVVKSELYAGELIRSNESQASTLGTNQAWKFALISPRRAAVSNSPEDSGVVSDRIPGSGEVWRWGLENESAKISIQALREWEKTMPGHAKGVLSRLPGVKPESVEPWLMAEGVIRKVNRMVGPSNPIERNSSADGEQNQIGSAAGLKGIDSRRNLDSEEPSSEQMQTSIWSGGDLNQNYRLDPLEKMWLERQSRSGSGAAVGSTSSTQEVSIALQRYITRYSGCRNERSDGSDRIYVNDSDLRALHRKLMSVWPQPLADYLILARQYGPTIASRRSRRERATTDVATAAVSGDSAASEIDWSIAGRYQIRSLLELVDSRLTIQPASNSKSSQNKTVVSPFSSRSAEGSNYLIKLLDDCTTDRRKFLEGKIDVWDAPLEVLMAIPEMDEGTASRIVSTRQDETVRQQSSGTIAWLIQRGITDLQTLRKWEPYITARSDVYTAQVLGFRDQTSSVYRCTVTIDGSQIPARPRELKTWHSWDAGFNLTEFVGESE